MVSVDRIFLDPENPRHVPYENQAEVIEYLCRDEYVLQLAKDISIYGLNPLEILALIPIKEKKNSASYIVAEGNRRMCAIKLLNDPDLAPVRLRKDFQKLSERSIKITNVYAVLFDDKPSVKIWMDRIHNGLQGGIGRKTWNAEQKTRDSGDRKNILAQLVLDYAQHNKFISVTDRKNKLTTVQRYLGNAHLREALGVDNSNLESLTITRPRQDFDILLKRFIKDLLSNDVNSRAKSKDILAYARSLGSTRGLSGERTAPDTQEENPSDDKNRRRTKPKKPNRPKHITYEKEISDKLKAIQSYKLESIYYSLCFVELEMHTPLLSVGVWAFFESLTAKIGRQSGTDFASFLQKSKLQAMGFTDNDRRKSITQAVKRLAEHGNTTKHHDTSANFNGEQLANDMDTLKDLICKLADESKPKKGAP